MAKDSVASVLLKPKAERGRNVFPLDNRQVYSIRAGQITPVRAQHFIPGDHYEISAHDFSMSFPMNTAAFLRGRKETCFYSVYYSSVWSLFNQYMATRQDPKTSAFGAEPKLQEPRIPLIELYGAAFVQLFFYFAWKYYVEVIVDTNGDYANMMAAGVSRESILSRLKYLFDNSTTLLQDNGGVCSFHFEDTSPVDYMGQAVNYYLQMPFPTDYLDYTKFFDYETIVPRGFSAQDGTLEEICYDVVGHFRVFSYVRKLDMLGYGNIYPLFKVAESKIIALSHADIDDYRTAFYGVLNWLYSKLVEICYTFGGTLKNPTNVVPKYVNLYSICAYNSVFYHFFRNSFYDLNYQPFDYSLDFVSSDFSNSYGTYNVVSINDFTWRFLDIEYHQWKKDVFTSVFPDTQFGAVSGLQINNGSLSIPSFKTSNDNGQWAPVNSGFNFVTGQNVTISANQNRSGTLRVTDSDNISSQIGHRHTISDLTVNSTSTNFDVISLKRAELLQDYRQTLMRAGNKTSDIFRALYGGEPSSEHVDDIIPRFLETFGEDIFVDPVTATASTDSEVNGTLGDLSARGKFRGDSKEFKFNAGKNFGVILCLTYLVPDAEYNSYLLDKHNLELSPEAHFLPPYENFGLEPVFSDELNMLKPANKTVNMGYSARYYHKKMALDLVHGAFCSCPAGFSDADVAPWPNPRWNLDSTFNWFGEFNHWVSPRTDLQAQIVTRVRRFYINPSVLDNVFVRAVSPDIADDQLICNTYFVIKSTRELTKAGLINFV